MRLIQANCTIRYTGRCETFLPEASRLIIIKDDGSVMIHVDSGIKPLNYMKASKQLGFIEQDDHQILYAANSKEELYIDMLEIISDIPLSFPNSERDMIKTGTEDLLQQAIYDNLDQLIPDSEGVCREYETGKGPVDVFGAAKDRSKVALVEVKRHAHRKDVYQVLKYGDAIDNMVQESKDKRIDAIEVKQKGDHDGNGEMIPIEAFERRELYLASRKFARGTKEEAEEHNVGIIDVSELDVEGLETVELELTEDSKQNLKTNISVSDEEGNT